MPTLACAGAVAEEETSTEAHCVRGIVGRGRDHIAGFIDAPRSSEVCGLRLTRVDHSLELGVGQQAIAQHGGATVLVVTHVTPIKTMLRMALDAGPTILYRLHLDLASLSIAEFYPDGLASVRLVNETSYL